MKKRIPMIAGNWKMNKNVEEARLLLADMLPKLSDNAGVEIVICPPFPSLLTCAAMLKGTSIGLGAQDMHWEAKGAFTGAVSPAMVAEFCHYVIIGHSERRGYFGETDEIVNKKVISACRNNLIPIICVGETLPENESGLTEEVVSRQTRFGLEGLSTEDAGKVVIAYEPVWAIGTGRASSGLNAETVIRNTIRPTVASILNDSIAQGMRILYGGSVTAANAREYFSISEIDGALVGGASLKADEFSTIVNTARDCI